jgi:hypothetical protein
MLQEALLDEEAAWKQQLVPVTSQFLSILKKMQGNPLKHSSLSKSEIFSMEYSRM